MRCARSFLFRPFLVAVLLAGVPAVATAGQRMVLAEDWTNPG